MTVYCVVCGYREATAQSVVSYRADGADHEGVLTQCGNCQALAILLPSAAAVDQLRARRSRADGTASAGTGRHTFPEPHRG